MRHFLFELKDYLEDNGFFFDEYIEKAMINHETSVENSFSDHVRFLIYAFISQQRRWATIEDNYQNIREIFFDWDVVSIMNTSSDYFVKRITEIRCGNRMIKNQMYNLNYNIAVLLDIRDDFGSIDKFISKFDVGTVIRMLTDYRSKYKILGLGPVLAQEYLRNAGVDSVKADIHLRRFLGTNRMGKSKAGIATKREVEKQVKKLSLQTGLKAWEIDQIIWQFCASNYANICGAKPRCSECPIRNYCSKRS